jgi:D-glycero-D-manno-heptose 1,7-bisphosphate phosphatase
MNRAAFLDRDGVINQKAPQDGYITRWEDVEILPGVGEAISLLNRAGFHVIIVTNQRCIAKKLITTAELDAIHHRIRDGLARAGATIHEVYYCPHELQPPCTCRKPHPGMLLEAARAHGIDLNASWMIGDSNKDVEAGRNAGCKTARLLRSGETGNVRADLVARSLLEAARQILQLDGTPASDRLISSVSVHRDTSPH